MAKQNVTPIKGPGKAVTTAASTAVSTALAEAIAADSGAGFEEATRESFAIPFLVVLQDLSPQTKPKKAEYVKGAEPGMLFNTVSGKTFSELRVIPCHYSPTVLEWIPRDKGGGFVAAHPANTPLLQQASRDGARNTLPNGHELQLTAQHFALAIDSEGERTGVLIAMKSTQLKYSRRWMSQMRAGVIEVGGRLINPPMFAWSYKLSTEEESNDQGTWWSWVIGDRQRVEDINLYNEAKAFAQTMKAGAAKVNYEDLATQSGGEGPADLDNEIDA